MKKFIAAIAIVATAFTAQAQTQKTLVKTFNPNGAKQVMVDLKNAKVVIKATQEDLIRVETTVNLKNGSEVLYNQLSQQGRYNLELSSATPITLSSKPRETVKVSGANLEEEISYVVYAPAGVDMQDTNSLAYGNKKSKGKAKAAPAKAKSAPKKKK